MTNNKDDIKFLIQADLESKKYAKVVGNNLIMPLIPTGKIKNSLKYDDTRKYPLVLRYGFNDISDFKIKIPSGFVLEKKEEKEINSEFGTYKLTYFMQNGSLVVNREILIKDGEFTPEKYNDYVKFRKQIQKLETQKILLTKN